ncbi:hypothetical protein OK016_20855 [Vibrio chagasii]|nr:hypothetical protein [Vibrio chagasii]
MALIRFLQQTLFHQRIFFRRQILFHQRISFRRLTLFHQQILFPPTTYIGSLLSSGALFLEMCTVTVYILKKRNVQCKTRREF